MSAVAHILFWLSITWLLHVFAGYPVLMWILARLHPRPLNVRPEYLPSIQIITAAYNEQENIGRKLDNYRSFDYPRRLLSCRIGSDGSTDQTDAIAMRHASEDDSITLSRYPRTGKTRIIYELAEMSDAEIIVFTDADVLLEPDAMRRIARCFGDPEVGGVVGTMVYHDPGRGGANLGEGLYSRLENSLRRDESVAWTTMGPTGQCFAVRSGSYHPPGDNRLSDDTYLTISIPLGGRRVWYDPGLLIHEHEARTLPSEIRRRLRVGRQNAATFMTFPQTRLPWRSRAGFQLWSHRILRNLSAVPAMAILICAIALRNTSPVYLLCLWMAAAWTLLALFGVIGEWFRLRLGVLGYPAFFTAMMVCLCLGAFRAWSSGGLDRWEPPRT